MIQQLGCLDLIQTVLTHQSLYDPLISNFLHTTTFAALRDVKPCDRPSSRSIAAENAALP
jgi:hypothetical protein